MDARKKETRRLLKAGMLVSVGQFQRSKVVVASLLTLAAVSYIDLVTGYEFLFFVFYFVPVGLCGWYLSRAATLAMASLSAASWFFIDIASRHHYPYEMLRYWNSFTCFLAFGIIGLVLHHLKESRDQQVKARRELETTLAELQASTEQVRNLQKELQVVCAWTQRIRLEGKWMTLDEFLANKLNIRVSHGISPEALERIMEQVEGKPPPREA